MARTKFTRQEAKLRTRKRLLDAARLLILAGGETRLTASNVARRAGVAGATFYEHFRNRDDMLRALSNDLFDQLRGKLRKRRREALAAPYDEDKLREEFRTPLELLAANPDLFRLALRVRHHPTSPLGDSSGDVGWWRTRRARRKRSGLAARISSGVRNSSRSLSSSYGAASASRRRFRSFPRSWSKRSFDRALSMSSRFRKCS